VRAVAIGGWLASEAARALRKRGCEVVIVEQNSSFDLELDAVVGDEHVEAVRFTSGEEFGADLVVIATDLEPNGMLAQAAGLKVNRGIVVNDQLATSDPYIFAIGGCTEQNGRIFDSFAAMREQAQLLARNLAGAHERGFTDLDEVFQELTASPLHHRAE
jgi:NAD(P)H-nitrite reductase large subunit